MDITVIEPPITTDLCDELLGFWQGIFTQSFEELRPVLSGDELPFSRDLIWVAREGGQVAGTCHLTYGHTTSALGGLGEVAVADSFLGRGIASTLCMTARDAFLLQGGRALFLATSNPSAFRVYHKLGWRRLAGSNVMVFIAGSESPEIFLAARYRDSGIDVTRPYRN